MMPVIYRFTVLRARYLEVLLYKYNYDGILKVFTQILYK